MITTLIRFIFLLLLVSPLSYAKNIDVTFEVFRAQNNYLDIARDKALGLQNDGFECYIIKRKKSLSLRCNDSNSTKQMQENINKLNKKGISYTIVNREKLPDKGQQKPKTLNEFYLGYAAFDRKDYKKALRIFEYNYKEENNYEHAYAYALALLKTHQYEKALIVLKPYEKEKKASKLLADIATTFMYKELNNRRYTMAHDIVNKYKSNSKKLHDMINKREVDDSISHGQYAKATTLATAYKLTDKALDIDYMKALDFVNVKKYDEANVLLLPYIHKNKKAKNLFMSNLVSSASLSFENKRYKEALDKLGQYRNDSAQVQSLYNTVLYNRALDNGWTFVEKNPKNALASFKESCSIKKEYSCYSGMMYSYYNLNMYKQSLYLADKLYGVEKKDELSIVAMRSALKLKDYTQAKLWFDKTTNKKGLANPYMLETFLNIDSYIKAENYVQARNIVNYLKNLYPNNIEVMKRDMQLLIIEKEFDKAQDVAENILALDKNSVEARYTLALYEFEHQDYSSCASRLSDANLTQDYQKELFNRCSAYEHANKKDINGAIYFMEKIPDIDVKSAFYIYIGDMYKKRGESEAIRAYEKAMDYQDDDIDLELLYLYALKDFHKDEQLEKEISRAFKKYPQENEKLQAFNVDYQKDRLYSYYKNKRYGECYNYSNIIEDEHKDKDVYNMGGWCAYSLQKYDQAKEKFAMINHLFGENAKSIYPYALSCYANDELQRAEEALDRIELIDDKKDALLIASLYMDLHKQSKAKNILSKLPPSKERDALFVTINKSYTQHMYENATSVGMYYQSQTGLDGQSKFDKYVVPIDYHYYPDDDLYHFYVKSDIMYLYNGYILDSNGSLGNFGLGTSTQDDALGSDIGFMPKVGIDYENIRVQIGTTPLGTKITPEITWLLSGYLTYDYWRFSLKYEQKEIDESMLSFVGEKAVDGSLEVNWGRVLKHGVEGAVSYDGNLNLSLTLGYYPDIHGLNTQKNSEFKTTFTAIYHPKVESISYIDLGAIVAYDTYDKNSNLFTYGHGGYFSPQEFWLGSLFAQFGDIVTDNFYYQARVALGLEGFIINDAYKFPLNDGIVNSGEIIKGYRDGGVTYKGAMQLGYKLNDNLDLISGFSLERMNGYKVQQASFALVYRFKPSSYRTLNTFGLNHRVDQVIK